MENVGELQAQSEFQEPGRLEKNFTKNLIYPQIGLNVEEETNKTKKRGLEIGIG